MRHTTIKSILSASTIALLVGCGGGGGGGDNPGTTNATLTGKFVDSTVQGLRWVTSGGTEGTTGYDGSFQYKNGEKIKFYVGGILLGEAQGDSIITPIELVPGAKGTNHQAVVNITRF